jgi:hypothetical protein
MSITGLEQNPDTKSNWARMAREEIKVMQFVYNGGYIGDRSGCGGERVGRWQREFRRHSRESFRKALRREKPAPLAEKFFEPKGCAFRECDFRTAKIDEMLPISIVFSEFSK